MSQVHAEEIRSAARSPADIYDEQFVPALFRQWGPIVCDAAAVAPGQRVLDVGCGTGVVDARGGRYGRARWSRHRTRRESRDAGRRAAQAHAGRLATRPRRSAPFADASFDAVASQFAMMFFDDRSRALAQMQRVLRPAGRLAVAVCDSVDNSPGYAALAGALERLFGKPVADAFRAPFALGDAGALRTLCAKAGLADAVVTQRQGTVRFRSIEALVSTERACVDPRRAPGR